MERLVDLLVYFVSELSRNKQIEELDIKVLLDMGYSRSEISVVLSWILERLGEEQKTLFKGLQTSTSSRRYLHDAEKDIFTKEGWDELTQLYTLGIITLAQMEMFIDRAAMMGLRRINAEQVKKVIGGFLFENSGFISFWALGNKGSVN